MIKTLLVIGIVATFVFVLAVYFDLHQSIKRELSTVESLINAYKNKAVVSGRSVIVLKCESGLCEDTLKSVLDQSVRVNDIAVETNRPDLVNDAFKRIVTVHSMDTVPIRELDANTVVIYLENGIEYPYDFVEKNLKSYRSSKDLN